MRALTEKNAKHLARADKAIHEQQESAGVVSFIIPSLDLATSLLRHTSR